MLIFGKLRYLLPRRCVHEMILLYEFRGNFYWKRDLQWQPWYFFLYKKFWILGGFRLWKITSVLFFKTFSWLDTAGNSAVHFYCGVSFVVIWFVLCELFGKTEQLLFLEEKKVEWYNIVVFIYYKICII